MAQPNKHQVPDRVLLLLMVKIAEVYKSKQVRYKEEWVKKLP